MPEVVWRGKDFSMRPVDPAATGDNPSTRVLNMVIRGSLEVRKRQNFSGDALSGGETLMAIGNVNNIDRLATKLAGSIKVFKASGSAGSITGETLLDATEDKPIGGVAPANTERGSFAFANGELYYADEKHMLAWDGTSLKCRRPGVPSLDGLDYVTMGLAKSPNDTGKYEGFGPPAGVIANHPTTFLGGGSEIWEHTKWSPSVIISGGELAFGGDVWDVGSKLLNTAFTFSWYDPKRRIYGRRGKPFALPYLFAGGPQAPLPITDLLSSARTQYAKVVDTPDPAGTAVAPNDQSAATRLLGNSRSDLQVAIWFTRGFLPAANTSAVINGGWWAATEWVPAMSTGMNDLMFLEKVTEHSSETSCGKDDASLYASGRYLDQYARPVPCRFMTILPNGTALYFWPKLPENRDVETSMESVDPPDYSSIPIANVLEFSVGHPETIGRNTNELRDTVSPVPPIDGEIIKAIPDGMASLLVTTQGIHRVGFARTAQIVQVATNRGIASPLSYQEGTNGHFWYAHEGVVWMRGAKTVLLDQELGFSDWFEDLPFDKHEEVAIGNCETLNQVITTLPGEDKSLCFDYAKEFASEFSDDQFTRAIFFHGKLRTDKGNYPGPLVSSSPSEVTVWISEDVNRYKAFQWAELKLGKGTGSVVVTVTAFDHPDTDPEYAGTVVSRNKTIALTSGAGQRVRLQDFLGMRGRMFKVSVTGAADTTDWGLQELRCEYTADEGADARSV